jgi:hypothetical protein
MRFFKNPWKFFLVLLVLMGIIMIATMELGAFLIYFALVGLFILFYIANYEEKFSNRLIKNNIKTIKKFVWTFSILMFFASPFILLYFIYWGVKEILRQDIPKVAKIFCSIQTILVVIAFVLVCILWGWIVNQYRKSKKEVIE